MPFYFLVRCGCIVLVVAWSCSDLCVVSFMFKEYLDTALYLNFGWNNINGQLWQKAKRFIRIGLIMYFLFLCSIVIVAFYGIVWDGQILMAVFTLLTLYMWCYNVIEGKLYNQCVLVMITQCEVPCLVSFTSCCLGFMTIV